MAAVAAALKKKSFGFRRKKAIEDDRMTWQAEIPPEHEAPRLADVVLGKWTGVGGDGAGGEWHIRRVIYTATNLYFTREGDDRVIDSIPLHEITLVEESKGLGASSKNGKRLGSVIPGPHAATDGAEVELDSNGATTPPKDGSQFELGTFEIHTIPDGYNSGRVYRLKAINRKEKDEVIEDLQRVVHAALKAWKAESQFQRSQQRVRVVFHSDLFQNTVALLIFANFVAHIAQHQAQPEEGSSTHRTLETLDVIFTLLFTAELTINAYAHWAKEFFTDGWAVFDLVAVTISLMSFFMTKIPNGAIFRVMRALRVLRLFGRMRRLRLIITALTTSIVPVLNAFLIMLIVTSIYAMIGISFFGDTAGEHFGSFDRAVMTMFMVTAGESWLPDLPPFQDDGSMNTTVVIFTVSFIVIVNWTLLQVSVAILLDNFVSATSAEEKEQAEQCKVRADVNSLDPLLQFFTHHYDTDADLTTRISQLYQTLDVDQDGTLDFDEILEGLRKLECDPRINLSLEDLERYTAEAGMDPKAGRLDRNGFETVMRFQLKEYAQRGITDAMLTADDPNTSAMLGSMKMMLLLSETRHANMVLKVHQVHAEVRQMRQVLIESFQALTAATLAGSTASSETQSQTSEGPNGDFDTDGDDAAARPQALLSEISMVGMKDPGSAENTPTHATTRPRMKRCIVPKPNPNANTNLANPLASPHPQEQQMDWPALLTMGETERAGAQADLVFLRTPSNSDLKSNSSRRRKSKARHTHHHHHHVKHKPAKDRDRDRDRDAAGKGAEGQASPGAAEASISIDLSARFLKMCQTPPITWYVHPSSEES